ncbi:GtrA family protein [Anoxybacillus sp. TBDG-1]
MMSNKVATIFRFAVVGVGNTFVDFGLFFLLVALGVPYMWAQMFGYSAGVINSYVWNRTWTFRAQGAIMKQFVRFLVINLCSFVVTLLLLYALNKIYPIFLSKVIATVGGMVVGWLGSYKWVFSERMLRKEI